MILRFCSLFADKMFCYYLATGVEAPLPPPPPAISAAEIRFWGIDALRCRPLFLVRDQLRYYEKIHSSGDFARVRIF